MISYCNACSILGCFTFPVLFSVTVFVFVFFSKKQSPFIWKSINFKTFVSIRQLLF